MLRRFLFAALIAASPVGGLLAQNPALPSGNDTVMLQFSPQSDVKEMLALYERLTGRRLIYDATVTGPVPLVINTPLNKEEAVKIMEIAFLMNGFSLVPTEDKAIWKVFGVGKNPRSGGVPIFSDAAMLPDNEQIVSYLFKLQYADPTELATQLTQAFPANPVLQGASMVPLAKAQALLVTENTAIIRQVVRIVQELDVPPAVVESKFFSLERADAKDVQEKLNDIFTKKEGTAGTPTTPGAQPGAQRAQVVRTPTTPEGLPLPAGAPTEGAATSIEINIGPNEENFVSGKVKITADARTNRLHVIARPRAMVQIEELIKEFDANVPFGEPSVYPLRFVTASDVFQVLVKAVSDPGQNGADAAGGAGRSSSSSNRSSSGNSNNLFGSGSNGNTRFGDSSFGSGGSGGSGGSSQTLSESLSADEKDVVPDAVTIGNARIIADKRDNKIIVVGNKDVKEKLFAVIKQLDVRAPQVMLHTCIGQLTLSENQQFGVNYIINQGRDIGNFAGTTSTDSNGNTTGSGGVISPPTTSFLNVANLLGQEQVRNIAVAGAGGLSGFFTAGNAFDAIVTALESTNKFRVVSRPVLFTSNNKKAIISSGEEIAIPQSIQSGFTGSTTSNGLVTNSSISYKTVALTLEVLPLINADGEVSMDIVQKVDEQVGSTRIDNNDIPRIATRVLKTNVSVPNNGTLVLGGLIKQRNNKSFTGIPLVSRIPLIGPLFRTTTYDKSREELVILIRPVVTLSPRESVKSTEKEQEYLRLEPDLEHTVIDSNLRERTFHSEEILRKPVAPGLRDEFSGRVIYTKKP